MSCYNDLQYSVKEQNNSMVRLVCMDLFNNLKFHYNMKQVTSSSDITLTF